MADTKVIIGILVLLAVSTAVLVPLLRNADVDYYTCDYLDDSFTRQCADETLCTNATYACLNASYPILNVTKSLCTNASGVSVFNLTPSDGCDAYTRPADNRGSPAAGVVLGVIPVILVLGVMYFIYKHTKKD